MWILFLFLIQYFDDYGGSGTCHLPTTTVLEVKLLGFSVSLCSKKLSVSWLDTFKLPFFAIIVPLNPYQQGELHY